MESWAPRSGVQVRRALYLLHAFGAAPDDWLGTTGGYEGLNVASTLDSLIRGGEAAELIVIMPDARTSLGGSWYASSPTSGRWEDFIAQDLVDYVDREFRTWADREHRSIVGQSMGAYGALRIAMRRPDVFGVVVAVSPVPVVNPNPLGEAGMRAALSADRENLSDASLLARVLWSRAAAFSPDPGLPPGFVRLPYREENGELVLIPEVWRLWEQATLPRLAVAHSNGLSELAVRLEVGDQDPVRAEVAEFSAMLDSLGVPHEFEIFPGGHVGGVRARFEQSVFQYVTSRLKRRGGAP